MRWRILLFIFLCLWLCCSPSFSSEGIYLTASQTLKLKQNLNLIKQEQTSLQLQLISSQNDLQNAKKNLTESQNINRELQSELMKLQEQSQKQKEEAKNLSASLTNALTYSKKQKKRANRAESIAVILIAVIAFK